MKESSFFQFLLSSLNFNFSFSFQETILRVYCYTLETVPFQDLIKQPNRRLNLWHDVPHIVLAVNLLSIEFLPGSRAGYTSQKADPSTSCATRSGSGSTSAVAASWPWCKKGNGSWYSWFKGDCSSNVFTIYPAAQHANLLAVVVTFVDPQIKEIH